jgi:hypothetical protein
VFCGGWHGAEQSSILESLNRIYLPTGTSSTFDKRQCQEKKALLFFLHYTALHHLCTSLKRYMLVRDKRRVLPASMRLWQDKSALDETKLSVHSTLTRKPFLTYGETLCYDMIAS